jgi:hypothetical protein
MWLDADPVKTLQRPPPNANQEAYKTAAVEGVDSSVSADEVLEYARCLSPRALRHVRQLGYADYAYAVAGAQSNAPAIP